MFESDISLAEGEHAQLNRKLIRSTIFAPRLFRVCRVQREALVSSSKYRENMADRTPVKSVPRPTDRQHVCRCCNSSFASHPIDLFGSKSESESLISIIENVTGLNVSDSDGLPRKICRNCHTRLKQFAEFKILCQKSRTQQESEIRLKRGKKIEESPSVAKEREAKRGKREGIERESSTRQNLNMQFALIHPKPSVSGEAHKEMTQSLVSSKVRILPKSMQPLPAAQPSKGVLILAKSGLRNSEVCKVANGLNFSNFVVWLCYILYSVEINKAVLF